MIAVRYSIANPIRTEKMHPKELTEAYARGENITALLKGLSKIDCNTEEMIETAYDLQSGSYVNDLNDLEKYQHKVDYGRTIAEEILALTRPTSILEAGVGEGTTFSFVLTSLNNPKLEAHGFDISWSRIATCRHWLQKNGQTDAFLSVASLLNLPYLDNSFDVVYTSHTIEPNGGNEKNILQEPPLIENSDSLFSAESLRAYPKIKGIPCLRSQDGVIASAYHQV